MNLLRSTLLRNHTDDSGSSGEPPRDALDSLLRDWHDQHRAAANANRDQLLDAVAADERERARRRFAPAWVRPLAMAASIGLVVMLAMFFSTATERAALAGTTIVMVPEGGRLDALAPDGQLIGPCPLKHTDVKAAIAGPFTRVTVTQRYENTYTQKVEAVYTFPLSHRGAVDRMTMTVTQPDGVRVVIGEMRERSIARAIYESAREQGYVASLLEQQRPNIFTQSVANIEPGAKVDIEISYIETLEAKDGRYSFEFPTVVGPRYVPGSPVQPTLLPVGCQPRYGVVMLAPPSVLAPLSPDQTRPWLPPLAQLQAALVGATPIATPAELAKVDEQAAFSFSIEYPNASRELAIIYQDGIGNVNGRWFWVPMPGTAQGTGFAPNTNQVPDASLITPMPVRPGTRAGHDLSIRVDLDTGGVPIMAFDSDLHRIRSVAGGPTDQSHRSIELDAGNELPNRDFILSWKVKDDAILEGVYSHWSDRHAPALPNEFDASSVPAPIEGGYLTVVVAPPAAVVPASVPARELIFVLDTSGSMNGFPIEKAKELMSKAIAAMRPIDTFNVITFAGDTHIMWPQARPATGDAIAEAQRFVDGQRSGGGTEMMQAINAALVQTARGGDRMELDALVNLPADGRAVKVRAPYTAMVHRDGRDCLQATPTVFVPFVSGITLPTVLQPQGVTLALDGAWATVNGERVLQVTDAAFDHPSAGAPMRVCMFLTDAYVGNDRGIVAAVRANARTTRVFSFGIGNSVNRWLIDEMAKAGRGESEVVTLAEDADAAVARFTRRIATPVLQDVEVACEGFEASAVTPTLIPDLFDAKPIVVHARYASGTSGTIVLRGRTGAGPWEKRIPVSLANAFNHSASDMLPSLWARAQVDDTLAPVLKELEQGSLDNAIRKRVISLGEGWQVMTPFTSFVAVEKARVTIGGRAQLVAVPIELPQGLRWEGFFGEWRGGCVPAPAIASGDDTRDHDGGALGDDAIEASFAAGEKRRDEQKKDVAESEVAGRELERLDRSGGARSGAATATRGVSLGRSFGIDAGFQRGGTVGTPGAGGFGGGGGAVAPPQAGDKLSRLGLAVQPTVGHTLSPLASTGAASGVAPSTASPSDDARRRKAADAKQAEASRLTLGKVTDGLTAARSVMVPQEPASPAKPYGGQDIPMPAAGREHDAPAEAAVSAAPPAEESILMLHDVRDLVGLGADPAVVTQAAERLMRDLQSTTGRELWTDQGGASAAWTVQDGLLLVEAWPSVQRTISDTLRARRATLDNAVDQGIDPVLIPADAKAAASAARNLRCAVLTTDQLDRVFDLLGPAFTRASLFGQELPSGCALDADGMLLVSVGLSAADSGGIDAAMKALHDAGLVDGVSNAAARLVIGRIKPSQLAAIALVPVVASIEPTQLSNHE